MKEFPTFRVKSFRSYYRKQSGPGPISVDVKLRERGKHMVVVALATVDEAMEIGDDWMKRAVAALAAAWGVDR
jgi:hypothetical protein